MLNKVEPSHAPPRVVEVPYRKDQVRTLPHLMKSHALVSSGEREQNEIGNRTLGILSIVAYSPVRWKGTWVAAK